MIGRVLLRSIGLLLILVSAPALACREPASLCDSARPGGLALIEAGRPLRVLTDPKDDEAVRRAAAALGGDLARVAGAPAASSGDAVIVGTIGRNPIIDTLIRSGRLDVGGVRDRWEAFVQQVVDNPAPGIARALVIAGADRRGAVFGAYDLSRRIGVSPWSWWADVPVPKRRHLFVLPGRHVDAPAVKYRGIFINDEDPALGGWARARFGGLNHQFYEHVFDLVLRLRGNLLWPAMWGKSFHEDDPENARLANAMGVIVGTSHHEPLMRAHVDWEHHGQGPWDYTKNAERLRAFWREGMERTQGEDRIVTVGMRGDGDEPMTKGTATELLERIVVDQRKIIAEVTGRPPEETPQVWALYKEVQDYYDAGMRVPDDVTLLFSDDNWGNVRRLPEPGAKRAGGYGVYYHFDYVGGPRNYKWIDTNPIQRVWQQMSLARAYGADRLWIVNVGDIKPMEFPTSFFLDMAWDPDGMTLERLDGYAASWAGEQFGPDHAAEIGVLLTRYGQLIARRKPELLDAHSYSLPAGEWARVMAEWEALRGTAEALEKIIPVDQRDAWFELVLHPILAAENLHRLYYAVARNLYAPIDHSALLDRTADEAEAAFRRDGEIRRRYEVETAGGKWTQMMSQTHIGYTGWQQPATDVMPHVMRQNGVPATADMGVSLPNRHSALVPTLSPADLGGIPIRIFNRGSIPFEVQARPGAPWMRVAPGRVRVTDEAELPVWVDWSKAPPGAHEAPVTLTASTGQSVSATIRIDNVVAPVGSGFVESGGNIAIEAEHHARAVGGAGGRWRVIPHLGRTLSGVAWFPQTAPAIEHPGGSTPHLVYPIFLLRPGPVDVKLLASPGLDVRGGGKHRYAVSVDGEAPRIVNLLGGETEQSWGRAVGDAIRIGTTRFDIARAGRHEVRIWLVDPQIVIQRVLVARPGALSSYLGPPESPRR